MRKIFYFFIFSSLTTLYSHFSFADEQKKIKVVATFSILGDIVQNIGGDRIELRVLIGPNSDAHVYQPTPADVQRVASAQVLFSNGLGFEGWMDRLIETSHFSGKWVVVTKGITPITESNFGVDPHAWQNIKNVRLYAQNVAQTLSAVDNVNQAIYNSNLKHYLEKLDATNAEIIALIANLPPNQRKVITSHDAFKYYEAAYGINFRSPQGLSTNAEASAINVAQLIRQIRNEKIPAIFIENITDTRLIEQIKNETGTKIGGTLYSDALSEKNQPADTYLHLMQHNTNTLVDALSRTQ